MNSNIENKPQVEVPRDVLHLWSQLLRLDAAHTHVEPSSFALGLLHAMDHRVLDEYVSRRMPAWEGGLERFPTE